MGLQIIDNGPPFEKEPEFGSVSFFLDATSCLGRLQFSQI